MNIGVVTGDPRVFKVLSLHSRRRLGIVGCAGGIRNSFLAGAHIYWRRSRQKMRLPIAYMGVSSAFATAAYFLGGGTATSARVFSDDMTDRRLFDFRRRFIRGQYPFDVDYVNRVFQYGVTGRPINAEQVMRQSIRLYGVVADPVTGRGWSELPSSPDDVWTLATAATAVTGFARATQYRGKIVTDGFASDMLLPVGELLRREPHLTDVLVFASQHYEPSPRPAPLQEQLLYATGLARATKPMQELIKTRHLRFMEEAERVVVPGAYPGVRVCMVWLPDAYHPIFVTKAESRRLIWQGYATMKLLMVDQAH